MNRKETAECIKIMQAFVDGKQIEFKDCMGHWWKVENPSWDWNIERGYRIKPEPKYHPFKNAEECWQEMQKHEPFGWVKWNDVRYNIYAVSSTSVCLINGNCEHMDFAYAHQKLIFADGTPFGIKEE